MNKNKILVLVLLIFILMGAVSASENVTDTSTNNDAVTGDVLASPDNSQTSSVADSNNNNNNVGNVTNVTKNNNSNLLSSPNTGGNVLNAPDDSFTALQTLINGAASGSTITLDKNYKFYADSDSAYVNGINITKSITINGNGYTIDGSNSGARLFVLYDHVTMNNLSFANVLHNGSGGAVYAKYTNIHGNFNTQQSDVNYWTIVRDTCHIKTDNRIYIDPFGSTDSKGSNARPYFYQDNILFDDINSLDISVEIYKPAQYYVYIDDVCVFSYAKTGTASLRTIFNVDCSKIKGIHRLTIRITFSPYKNNAPHVSTYYIKPSVQYVSSITANNCNFVNCSVTGDGGALYGGISSNLNNCNFVNCSAAGDGGALGGGISSNLNNCNFVNCSALNNGGVLSSNSISVTGSTFINNTAGGYGAVAATTTTGNTFTNNIIINNTGTSGSSSVFYSSNSATSYTLNNNWFGHNSTNKDNFDSIIAKPAKSTLNTWYYLDTETNNTYNVLWRNEANTQVRYAFKSTGSTGIVTSLPDITLSNVHAFNGTSDVSSSVSITNGVSDWFSFDAGNTYGDAGIIGDYNGAKVGHVFQIVPEDSFSALNRIIGESTTDSLGLVHGYHYYPEYDSKFITGIPISKTFTINGNNYTINAMNTARIFTIAGSVVLNNLTMINATSESSATHGGAITHSGGSLELNDCVFDNCQAVSGSTFYYGGALYSTGTALTIKRSSFNTCTET